MPKTKGADINDIKKIAEALLKSLNANKKFRDATKTKATASLRKAAELRKNDSRLQSSVLKPKITPKSEPKPKVETKKVKPSDVPSIGESGTRSRKPVKLSTPKRPARDKYAKGKTLAQTASEQRAAERDANRRLRQSGFTSSKPKNVGNAKPVDVRGSVIQPPAKATMRPAKPRGASAYEADEFTRQIRADRQQMGRGQKAPKKKPATPAPNTKKAVAERRAASKVAGEKKLADEIKRLRGRMAEAKTPEKKAYFKQQLNNLVIKTASDRAKGKGKYSNTRPLKNR